MGGVLSGSGGTLGKWQTWWARPADASAASALRVGPAPSIATRAVLLALVLLQLALHLATADGELSGDDHFVLWATETLWQGGLPNRDIYDPGIPLQLWLSYAGQLLTGHRPLGELLIAAAFRTSGLICVYLVTLRLTGRRWMAVIPPMLVALLLLSHVIYGADRLLLYPLAVLLAWRYLDGLPGSSQAPLAALTAIAFLLRHDHGVYVGIPLFLTILFARQRPWSFILIVAALLSPWLAWIAWSEGLVAYFASRIQFAAALGIGRARPGFGLMPESVLSQQNLLLLLWQVPIAVTAAASALAVWRKNAHVAVLAVTTAVMILGLVRILGLHPEAATLWLPLGAWILSRARRPLARAAAVAAASAVCLIVVLSTNALERVPQIVRENGGLLARVWTAFEVQTTVPPIDAYAPPDAVEDAVIVRYVYECLDPADRVWETSNFFPLPYQSERRAVEHVYWRWGFRSENDAEFAASLGTGDMPPLIVVREASDPLEAFAQYPRTQEIVRREYVPITSPRFEEYRRTVDVQLLRHRDRAVTGTFAALDLPCFRRTGPEQ